MDDLLWGLDGLEGLFDPREVDGRVESSPSRGAVWGPSPVTEVLVSGVVGGSGGVVRVQRGWSEESGYKSAAPTSPSEGSEVSLTELGASGSSQVDPLLKGSAEVFRKSPEPSGEDDDMVLVPSGKCNLQSSCNLYSC